VNLSDDLVDKWLQYRPSFMGRERPCCGEEALPEGTKGGPDGAGRPFQYCAAEAHHIDARSLNAQLSPEDIDGVNACGDCFSERRTFDRFWRLVVPDPSTRSLSLDLRREWDDAPERGLNRIQAAQHLAAFGSADRPHDRRVAAVRRRGSLGYPGRLRRGTQGERRVRRIEKIH